MDSFNKNLLTPLPQKFNWTKILIASGITIVFIGIVLIFASGGNSNGYSPEDQVKKNILTFI